LCSQKPGVLSGKNESEEEMNKITTFFWFDHQAEEAANFYVSIFKDAHITSIARYGEVGPGEPGKVMTISFELFGQEYTALNGGPYYKITPAVSFVIHCADQSEVDFYWEKLSAGGAPGQCGWLEDQFGVSWQIVPDVLMDFLGDEDPVKAARVTTAMLKMNKLDISLLKQAYLSD
jgi:predicted 3-demethylubiquinone-9 3-methyltransferase (glyoxalase superfamily)